MLSNSESLHSERSDKSSMSIPPICALEPSLGEGTNIANGLKSSVLPFFLKSQFPSQLLTLSECSLSYFFAASGKKN